MSPSPTQDGTPRGWIVPIGGAEEKISDPVILERFHELAGGSNARVAIIPTASSFDETGERYVSIFTEMGVESAFSLPYRDRKDTERKDWLEQLMSATGVFFTGGNQLRISTTLGGTEVSTLVRRMNANGVIVGGTSAGAAIIPEHMIAYGSTGSTPVAGMVSMAPGLGLTNRFLVDQHFRERDRLGRLLCALSYNPFAVGLGLDEDTAAFISPENTVEVIGSGSVTVVDVASLGHSSVADASEGEPLCMTDIRVHIIPHGGTFSLEQRTAAPPQ